MWVCVPKSPVPAEYPCSFKKVLSQNIRGKADVISMANSVGPWGLCKTVVKSLQPLGWVRTMLVALKGWLWAVRFAGCTCVYLIHSHLTCRELWIQLENNTHLQLIAWDISFNSSWRELDAWIGSELHFLIIMLLIMANLLFVNNVLSKVGRHDTHLLGGGSDFLLGITQDGVCHGGKHLFAFQRSIWTFLLWQWGRAEIPRAASLETLGHTCFSSDMQGLRHVPTYFSLHLDQICEKICSRSH